MISRSLILIPVKFQQWLVFHISSAIVTIRATLCSLHILHGEYEAKSNPINRSRIGDRLIEITITLCQNPLQILPGTNAAHKPSNDL